MRHAGRVKVLIYPYWNVNIICVASHGRVDAVLIYPYWNVNKLPDGTPFIYDYVLIYPYWNVNELYRKEHSGFGVF